MFKHPLNLPLLMLVLSLVTPRVLPRVLPLVSSACSATGESLPFTVMKPGQILLLQIPSPLPRLAYEQLPAPHCTAHDVNAPPSSHCVCVFPLCLCVPTVCCVFPLCVVCSHCVCAPQKMGRRAKKQKVNTAAKVVVATRFKCPFCNHEDSVECKMENSKGKGTLSCRICDAGYEMPIHYLSEPIDVFYEWLDACEKAQNEASMGVAVSELENIAEVQEQRPNASMMRKAEDDVSDTEEAENDLLGIATGGNSSSDKPARSSAPVEEAADEPDAAAVSQEEAGAKRTPTDAGLGFSDDSDSD